jgi:hypothetical protein
MGYVLTFIVFVLKREVNYMLKNVYTFKATRGAFWYCNLVV